MKLPLTERLPIELIQRVCLFLDRRTLSMFSVANAQCHAAATPLLFRKVCINIFTAEKLRQEVLHWVMVLNRNAKYLHVRTLDIEDGFSLRRELEPRIGKLSKRYEQDELSQGAGELRTWSEAHIRQPDDHSPHKEMETERVWWPLLILSGQLSGLNHVIYGCSDPLPEYVLKALQRNRPQCRFSVKNLMLHAPDELDAALYLSSMQIAPMLHSFSLKLDGEPSPTMDGHRENLLRFDQILQQAPALKHVHVWWDLPERFEIPGEEPVPSELLLAHVMLQEKVVFPWLGSWTSLQLRIDKGFEKPSLEYWARRTDFAKLKVLKMEGPMRWSALEQLDMARTLASLETLVLDTCWPRDWTGNLTSTDLHYVQLVEFLRNLKPLLRLRIRGCLSRGLIESLLEQHGTSLRQLWLENNSSRHSYAFDSELVVELCQKCLVLEDLRFPMRRSGGDAKEVASYVSLGSISTLRRLYLSLDVLGPRTGFSRIPHPTDSSFDTWDDFDRQFYLPRTNLFFDVEDRTYGAVAPCLEPLVYNGQVRNAIINCAVDQNLAQAIYEAISFGKSSSKTRLESLQVEVARLGILNAIPAYDDLSDVLGSLNRSYILVRDARNTHHQQVFVKEVRDKSSFLVNYPSNTRYCRNQNLDEILRRLWSPDEEPSGVGWWREKWHSFPLAAVEDVGQEAQPDSRWQSFKLYPFYNFSSSTGFKWGLYWPHDENNGF